MARCPGRTSRQALAAIACVGAASACAVACFSGAGPAFIDQPDATAPPPVNLAGDTGTPPFDVDLGDPFAIAGLVPAHGPFTGGTRAILDGRGFPSNLRVWIGGTELAPSAIFASDPTRAAVETPPGAPGPADVRIRDDATGLERTLPAGFYYDAFVLQPNQGATTGGTRVTVITDGIHLAQGAVTVTIDGKPCTDVVLANARLQCTTPSDSVGSKDVSITDAYGAVFAASDAFLYSDSPDGYRGGLGGGTLAGTLTVLAFDGWVGTPIPGAYAIAGSITKTTDGAGMAQITDPSLTGAVTVTVAAPCHQPVTYVGVPVDTVTAYLTPILTPSCMPPGHPDPPSGGGGGPISGPTAGALTGQLVFPGVEFAPGAWTVPQPTKPSERQAAYVFASTGSPTDGFSLPAASQATTPADTSSHGYAYSFTAAPGNVTLYALAGIEDAPDGGARTFVPYAMGVTRGVRVDPGAKIDGVDIPMTTLIDHAVTLAPSPPTPGPRGPDRLGVQVAVTLGQTGYAVFPNGMQVSLLPAPGEMHFVGLPALGQTLSGESYVITAEAVTGPYGQPPASIVGSILTTDSDTPVAVGGFLAAPVITLPGAQLWSGTHVTLGVSGAIDLIRVDVTSGGGFTTWTIVAPGTSPDFDLPDLGALAGGVGLVHGSIDVAAYVARIDGTYSYGTLRTGQTYSGGWSAYAFDAIQSAY